jgi:hypothetical protein
VLPINTDSDYTQAARIIKTSACVQDKKFAADCRRPDWKPDHCVRCYAIDRVCSSPLNRPFSRILSEPRSRGAVKGVIGAFVIRPPTMPQLSFEADQVRDFIAFPKTRSFY